MDPINSGQSIDADDVMATQVASDATDISAVGFSIIAYLKQTFRLLISSLLAVGIVSISTIFYLNFTQNTLASKIEPIQSYNNQMNSILLEANIASRSYLLTGRQTFLTQIKSDEVSYSNIYNKASKLQNTIGQPNQLLKAEQTASMAFFTTLKSQGIPENLNSQNSDNFANALSTIASSLKHYENVNANATLAFAGEKINYQNHVKFTSIAIIAVDILLLVLAILLGIRRTRISNEYFSQLISRLRLALKALRYEDLEARLPFVGSIEESEIAQAIVEMAGQRQLLEQQLERQYQQEKTSRENLEEERSLRAVLADTLYKDLDSTSAFQRALAGFGSSLRADRAIIRAIENGMPGSAVFTWESPNLIHKSDFTNETGAIDQIRRIIYEESPDISQDLYRGKHVLVNDIANDGRLSEHSRFESLKTGLGAFMAVPVIGNSGPEAVLVALVEGKTRNWTERDVQIGTTLAAGLSATLAAIHLYDQEKHSLQVMKELDQAKDHFIASVSHELRTPLTSIVGYLELLQDELEAKNMPAQYSRMINAIDRNSHRLLDLIENILTTSRIESGKLELTKSKFHVSLLLMRAAEAVMPHINAKNIDLQIQIPENLPDIVGDPSLLDRAILNLLSNAIKFTPNGGSISVTTWRDANEIAISIRDTGIGISEPELEKLFTKFFRTSNARQGAVQGTGLGLVIVKAILEAHKGSISVDSELEKGTAFTIRLPCT